MIQPPDLSGMPFGQRGFAAGLDQFGPGLLSTPAAMLMASPQMRLMSMAPRLAGAAATYFGATDPAGGAEKAKKPQAGPDPVVLEKQKFLKQQGYDVEMDGYTGPKTEAAAKTYDAKIEKQRTDALKLKELELGEKKQTAADTAAAEATKLRAQQDEAGVIAQRRYEDQSTPGWWEKYGAPYGGAVGGALEGGLSRWWLGKQLGKQALQRAATGESLAAERPTDLPGRIGRVNEFATTGGARDVPFLQAPLSPSPSGHPWTPNPNATPPRDLYRQGPGANYGPGALTAGMAGLEGGLGYHYQSTGAEDRKKAEEDFARLAREGAVGPEYEAVLQRLQQARGDETLGVFMERMARGALGGGGLMEAKSRILDKSSRPRGVGKMEAEQGRITNELNTPQAPIPLLPAPLPPAPLALSPPRAAPSRVRHPKGAVDADGNKIGGRYIGEE